MENSVWVTLTPGAVRTFLIPQQRTARTLGKGALKQSAGGSWAGDHAQAEPVQVREDTNFGRFLTAEPGISLKPFPSPQAAEGRPNPF